ncbi:hypothetical protein EYV94_20380 [Puteibacter caeruleilacunae]|nr:hypothetical protein EYV94_20380 [Puteibacter caeruleilacunae]
MRAKNTINLIPSLILLLICAANPIKAQVEGGHQTTYWNLEDGIPTNWQSSNLKVSNKHYKVGAHSIEWNWSRDGIITIDHPKGINESFAIKDKQSERVGGLMCWIYNTQPIDDFLEIEFGQNQQTAYKFPFYLNFKGWRACWVRFSEMDKVVNASQLDFMKIKAPQKHTSGTLYFDRISFNGKPIHARSTPDQQLPFINPKVNHNHWGGQWYWETNYHHDISLETNVSDLQQQAFRTMEKRLTDMLIGTVPSQDENWYYKDNFNDMKIIRHQDGEVSGRPIVSADEYDPLLNDLKPKHLGPVFYGLARGYILSEDDHCKEMFLDLFDHFIDQGYDYGSGTGTQHHFGYQMERIPESFFLMKDVLKKTGRIESAARMLSYWYGIAECRKDKKVQELQGVADLWNTKMLARVIAILLKEDSPEKVREMKALSRLLDNTLQYSTGTVGGIMPDGSLFHHAGLYPAYMSGALAGVIPVVYVISETPFMVGNDALHNLVQSTMLVYRFSNKYDWSLGISGRHPFAGKISQKFIEAMASLAKVKTNGEINKELASVYMHLASPLERDYNLFWEKGIRPITNISEFTTVNYGCLGLHRRNDWLVSVRGYSKYVWSGEIYQNDNRWGRYMSYGTVQINNSGAPISSKSSGYVQDGWDWNRFPGTTTIHLPLDKLYCPTRIMMSRTDESFCGSSSLEGKNGIFGMKLHEYINATNFTPDHRALKSVFCFDNVIICVGSNIENSNNEYPTETTLFQLESSSDSIIDIDGQKRHGLYSSDLENNKEHIITDNKGNRYFIPKKQLISVGRKVQYSKHNKSERETTGIFASAWINHGKAPKDQAYEYAVVVNGEKNGITPQYEVLKQDNEAHIIHDYNTGITGFVFFEPGQIKHEIIRNVTHESLVMIRKEKSDLILSLCSPSINLGSPKFYDSKGSIPISVDLTLQGKWEIVQENTNCKGQVEQGKTKLTFHCIDGKPVELRLKRIK